MDITEYINLYLEGKLSPDELNQFEEKRKNDKEFDLEVKAQIKIYEVSDRVETKRLLKEVEKGLFLDKTSLIDSYIDGNLQEDYKNYFDARNEVDNDFGLEIESQRQIRNNIERSSIKEQLNGIEAELDKEKTKPPTNIIKLVFTYSSIAAILIIGFFVIKNIDSSDAVLLSENNKMYVIGSSGGFGIAGADSLFVNILVYTDDIDVFEYEFQNKELKIYIPENTEYDSKLEIKLQYNTTEDTPYMLEFNGKVYYIDITKKRKRLEYK